MLDIAIGKPYCFLLCIFRVAASSNLPFSLHINRGNDGTGASSTCNGINQGGSWCNVGQANCEEGCQGKWCTNDGNPTPTPPPSPPLTPPPVLPLSTPSTPKPTLRPVVAPTPPTDTYKCDCSLCTASVLSKDASGYSVISRIDWVVANMAKTETEACNLGE